MKKKQTFDCYSHYANKAANKERSGNYAEAAKLWGCALLFASLEASKKWCEARRDFCLAK
ncbi:ANR family transcriptional regulator [Conservatibacter flavescens]|uniref:ANR family transcriptional regulator n=1 Tax=Conservatibacter flavescens TaxID=28161 RepID=A0A2M8S4Y1_9PAST|nr:ANR family transcriptional regulator [Conservatibacter flavescens]PJG86191.1 hypothetical protein CVP05_03200 [Conservatibacter flavescens]